MTDILPTRNEPWGFYGTMSHLGAPDTAWAAAFQAILDETKAPPEGVRDFLDSRLGRHFADTVTGYIGSGLVLSVALRLAIEKWQSWPTNRVHERQLGIPAGMPYLTGWAHHFAIQAEAETAGSST